MLLSVKHPSFGIRPPGAPTSIRPPRSAHGSGSSLFRRPGRAMPHPDRTTPASEPPLAEPVPAPEPLRRPTSRPAPAEPSPARRPQRRPDRAEKKPQDFDWGPAILATSVTLIIVGLILVGSLDNDRQGNTARRARPTRAASAPRFSASSRAAAPTPSDTEDSPWKRAWSVDLELDDNAITNTYVNSDHLVVYDQANKEQRLRGYGLTDGRPRELWSITPEGQPEAITSTVLVTSRSLIDLATGEATDAPWDRLSEPVLVTEDFIMTCAKKDSAVTCAGWDLAGKTLTQRSPGMIFSYSISTRSPETPVPATPWRGPEAPPTPRPPSTSSHWRTGAFSPPGRRRRTGRTWTSFPPRTDGSRSKPAGSRSPPWAPTGPRGRPIPPPGRRPCCS